MENFCRIISAVSLLVCGPLLLWGCKPPQSQQQKPRPEVSFAPQEVADALHGIIAAERDVYAREVVERFKGQLDQLGIAPHMLRQASHKVQQHGAEFHYVARSLWPLSAAGRAETDVEEKGLRFVLENRDRNFYSEEFLGGRRYFTAVYADVAVVSSCVECHNAHKNSNKHDFKTGDAMGAIVVRVPLEF